MSNNAKIVARGHTLQGQAIHGLDSPIVEYIYDSPRSSMYFDDEQTNRSIARLSMAQ